ncbi:MAG: hypothetical protein U1E76_21945 [Planctomycetota bacterium]
MSSCWSFPDPHDQTALDIGPSPAAEFPSTRTDAQGEFTIDRGERWALLALAEGLERGAVGVIDSRHPDDPLTLVLAPLVELRFTFAAHSHGDEPRTMGAWPFPAAARFSPVGKCISAAREFRFKLPAADYEIGYSTDIFDHDSLVSTGAIATLDHDAVDMGAVQVELPRVAHLAGHVVDGGDPVPEADVAAYWFLRTGESKPRHGACTDADGRFEVKVALYDTDRPQALLALDARRERAGLVRWRPDTDTPLTIELGPAIRVHGTLSLDGKMPPPSFTSYVSMRVLPEQIVIATDCQHGSFDFLLPAGRYRFDGYGGDVVGGWDTESAKRDLELADDQRDVDLGSISLPLPATANAVGKPAPALTITDARGVDKRLALSDFKGKWVLIEFWGFW